MSASSDARVFTFHPDVPGTLPPGYHYRTNSIRILNLTLTLTLTLTINCYAIISITSGVRLCQHITPTLRDTLHWLTVLQSIYYNIGMMTSNCVLPILLRRLPSSSICWCASKLADHRDLVEPQDQLLNDTVLRVSASPLQPYGKTSVTPST